MDESGKIFSIEDVMKFCNWAYDNYRLEGVISSGDNELKTIIYEFINKINEPKLKTLWQYKTKQSDWTDATDTMYETGKHLVRFEWRQKEI